jgi:hypothetical protein
VAWDDSPLCQLTHPPLTALSRDIPAYGAHAARLLLSAVHGERVAGMRDETAHLSPRGSTAPPAATADQAATPAAGQAAAPSARRPRAPGPAMA